MIQGIVSKVLVVGGCWRVLDDSKKRNQILKQVQDDIPFFYVVSSCLVWFICRVVARKDFNKLFHYQIGLW